MKIPSYLKAGDKVAIVAPAGIIDPAVVERGASRLRVEGFEVVIGRHTFDRSGSFAGGDRDRAADLQWALDDRSIRAIFFARGGYGSLRTFQHLNWSSYFKNPKWLVGFSDITVFHAYLSRHRIASLHGVMTAWFEQDGVPTESFLQLLALLKGEPQYLEVPAHPLNRKGSAAGVLTGGNLSLIQSLRGTALDIQPQGKLLFLEDLQEFDYHIDRMMQNLKAGKLLEHISGLLVGYFTAIKFGETPFGQDAFEIIREAVEPYDYPVAFGIPSGHELPNYPLMLGGRMILTVRQETTILETATR